jgi:hypothetical protein
MKFEPDESELWKEQKLVYGLLEDVEGLASGWKYSPGKVPTTLIFQTANNDGDRLTVSVDKIREICGGDMERTFDACRNLSVAIDAEAQMLVFEKELEGELAPPPGSGILPETIFAVGQSMNSPREHGFVVLRSRGELDLGACPNWREYDDNDNERLANVLPDDSPTEEEQEAARDYLREIGIEVNRQHGEEQDQQREQDQCQEEDERQEQGRGYSQSM